jgi:hypothetical protein
MSSPDGGQMISILVKTLKTSREKLVKIFLVTTG